MFLGDSRYPARAGLGDEGASALGDLLVVEARNSARKDSSEASPDASEPSAGSPLYPAASKDGLCFAYLPFDLRIRSARHLGSMIGLLASRVVMPLLSR